MRFYLRPASFFGGLGGKTTSRGAAKTSLLWVGRGVCQWQASATFARAIAWRVVVARKGRWFSNHQNDIILVLEVSKWHCFNIVKKCLNRSVQRESIGSFDSLVEVPVCLVWFQFNHFSVWFIGSNQNHDRLAVRLV